jgi:hypothetical protein
VVEIMERGNSGCSSMTLEERVWHARAGSFAPHLLSFAEIIALVERYQRERYVFLYRLVTQAEQVSDLLQDSYYDAWRAAQRGAAPLIRGGAHEEVRRRLFHAACCRAISALRRRDSLGIAG